MPVSSRLRSILVGLLVVVSVCGGATTCVAQLAPGAVVLQVAPQVLLSVSKSNKQGLLNVEAKNVPVADLLRAIATESGTRILWAQSLAPTLQSKMVQAVCIKDSPLEPILRLLTKAWGLKVWREEVGWVIDPDASAGPAVECSYRLLSIKSPEPPQWDAAGGSTQTRAGIVVQCGRFGAQLNAMLTDGRATIINEPHLSTMDGCPTELSISTEAAGPAPVEFPYFTYRNVETTLRMLPKIAPDGSIDLILSLSTAWQGPTPSDESRRTEQQLLASSNDGNEFRLSMDLPRLHVQKGEEVLLGGWDGLAAAEGRQTVVLVKVSLIEKQ